MSYISLYSQIIKKAIRRGPHRVAVFNMLWTHCLDGIICLINVLVNSPRKAVGGGIHWYVECLYQVPPNKTYQVCFVKQRLG